MTCPNPPNRHSLPQFLLEEAYPINRWLHRSKPLINPTDFGLTSRKGLPISESNEGWRISEYGNIEDEDIGSCERSGTVDL
jgi:hypothetical protein